MPCPLLTYAIASWRQAKVCLRPLPSYGEDRASRPPPLQHRVPIRAASTLDHSNVSAQRRPSSGLLRGFFSHRSGHLWEPAQAPGLTRVVLFQPRGIQDVHMSLSTLFMFGRRSAAASLWYVRNPCVIQADSEPPGRLPPAPGSHIRRSLSVTGGPFVSSGGVGLSSTLADSRRISFVPHGIPSYDMSLDALP